MLGKRKIRKNTFELLFGYEFNKDETPEEYFNRAYDNFACQDDENESVKTLFLNICNKLCEIDETISKHLQSWKLNRLSKATISILRLSSYEMIYEKLPPAVSINEAVELAKQYCEEKAPGFINGILNNIAKEIV